MFVPICAGWCCVSVGGLMDLWSKIEGVSFRKPITFIFHQSLLLWSTLIPFFVDVGVLDLQKVVHSRIVQLLDKF